MERAHLAAFQRHKRHGVAVVSDKLHLESLAVAMHEHHGAYISPLQSVGGQVAHERYGIEFFDRVHRLGSGCAVTKRGTSLPGLI